MSFPKKPATRVANDQPECARAASPCSLRAVNRMIPVSSPTVHSAILCGFPPGLAGRSSTSLASSTCEGQKTCAALHAKRPRADRRRPGVIAHLDGQIVPAGVWPQLIYFHKHGLLLLNHLRSHNCQSCSYPINKRRALQLGRCFMEEHRQVLGGKHRHSGGRNGCQSPQEGDACIDRRAC